MRPSQRLRASGSDPVGGAVRAVRIVGLGVLLWMVASEHHSDGSPRVPAALLAITAAGWITWLVCSHLNRPKRETWLALGVVAGVGGVVGGLAPLGITFPAVSVIATASLIGVRQALTVAALGAVALTTTVLAARTPNAIIAEGLLALAAAILGGASRRQYQERVEQAEQLLAERQRGDAEHARAAALAERNRIGREVHDVLAHSLGALSVQLEAADALLETDGDIPSVRKHVQQARRLAVDGLVETRRAVHALRDEPGELRAQIATLASAAGAPLSVTGAERRLDADVELALYRAAQEALSNARKHAPGAAVTLRLDYGPTATVLVVENGPRPSASSPSPLTATGGGFGLRGMRERIELLGGDVSAAAQDSGWTVRATVPV
ncbi:MAG TPA: histidine kinase [Acidothermaceae bacterium]